MIPPDNTRGLLPGVHAAGGAEFVGRFGATERRRRLLRGRAAQKECFGGELFPAELPKGLNGRTFLEFFQTDRESGAAKGIVVLSLDGTDLGAMDLS